MAMTTADPELLNEVLEHSASAHLVVDGQGAIEWATPQVHRLLGVRPGEIVGKPVESLLPRTTSNATVRNPFTLPVSDDRRHRRGVHPVRHSGGRSVSLEIEITPLDEDRLLAALREPDDDLVERERLRDLANLDDLTGVANRRGLLAEIETRIARARRSGSLVGLAYVDLDRFKETNDLHGHEAGDVMLRAVARRLQRATRPGDAVGRIGGDEFVVCVELCGADLGTARLQLWGLATRILRLLGAPITYAGTELSTEASIGLTLQDGDTDADELLRIADGALYEAKGQPGSSQIFARPSGSSTRARPDVSAYERPLGELIRLWKSESSPRPAGKAAS